MGMSGLVVSPIDRTTTHSALLDLLGRQFLHVCCLYYDTVKLYPLRTINYRVTSRLARTVGVGGGRQPHYPPSKTCT